MKKVNAIIKDGKIELDFDGFVGNSCDQEEQAVRLLLGKMGIKTDVKESDRKERQTDNIAERDVIRE